MGQLEVELSCLIAKQQQLDVEKTKLLRGADDQNNKVTTQTQQLIQLYYNKVKREEKSSEKL